jgi:hypothetical protein
MRKIQQPPAPEIVYGSAKPKESVAISREVRAGRLRGFDREAINRITNGLFDTIHNMMPLNEADNRCLSTCGHA